jgi:hypothetical protein
MQEFVVKEHSREGLALQESGCARIVLCLPESVTRRLNCMCFRGDLNLSEVTSPFRRSLTSEQEEGYQGR